MVHDIPTAFVVTVYLLSHDYASMDLCKVLLRLHVRLPSHLSVIITECSLVSIKAVLKPNVAVHLFICADLRVQVAPFIYARIEVTARLVLRIGRHGLYVHGCGIVDLVIKARSLLFTDAIAQVCLDALIRLLSGPFCERGRTWCREMNYCLDISPNPYPVTSSCYGVWRNKPPRVADDELDLHSHPVCTCREMEGGVSVNIEVMLALAIITSPKDQAYFFIHEKDTSYIFECMRKGRAFNGMQTLVSSTSQTPFPIWPC
uniref:Uncharacterized protein n=1 Tax=Sphaerodactylus townsendi TaxID=933632 RepID=A0ACB8F784_9SAUR